LPRFRDFRQRFQSFEEWAEACRDNDCLGEAKSVLRKLIDPQAGSYPDAWLLYRREVIAFLEKLPESTKALRHWHWTAGILLDLLPFGLAFPDDFPDWLPGGVWADELDDVEDYLVRHEERLSELRAAIAPILTEREFAVFWQRYGYEGRSRKQAQLADELGISQARVAQLERAALSKLKTQLGTWLA
jgi:RNA polymerase sigma factor (sigma-70 family)